MSWLYSAQIPIDTSSTGSDTSTDLENFPLLVRLNTTNFDFSEANISGADIRFEDRNGFPLNYEIDSWVTSGNADLWVSVPDIWGDRADNYVIMRWGNPSASGVSGGEAVFSHSYGYTMVAHLQDADDVYDATGNAIGTFNSTANTVSGVIASGCELDTSYTQYMEIAHDDLQTNSNCINNPSGMTFSIWAYPYDDLDSKGARATLFSKGIDWSSSNFQDYLFSVFNSGAITIELHDATAWRTISYDPGSWSTNTWYKIDVTWTIGDSTAYFYRDGTQIGSSTGWNGVIPSDGNGKPIQIGRHYGLTDDSWWYGVLDEARVQNMQRSDDWIKLEYDTQKVAATTLVANQFEGMFYDVYDLPAATGYYDITSPKLSGQIPKAVAFYWVGASGNGTDNAHNRTGAGGAVSTGRQFATSCTARDSLATSITHGMATYGSGCIALVSATSAEIDGLSEFVSFIPSGVRVNTTDAYSQMLRVQPVFFTGDETKVQVGKASITSAVNNSTTVNDVGFMYRGMLLCGGGRAANAGVTTGADFAVGVSTADTSGNILSQCTYGHRVRHGYTGGGNNIAEINSDYGLALMIDTTYDYHIEVEDVTASGFDITTRGASAPAVPQDDLFYLAFDTPNKRIYSGPAELFGSTGTNRYNGYDQTPETILMFPTAMEASGTVVIGDRTAASAGFYMFDAAEEDSMGYRSNDGANPTDEGCRYDQDTFVLREDNDSSLLAGDFVSMDGDGFTINLTTAEQQTYFMVLSVGVSGVVPTGPVPFYVYYRNRRT